MGEDLNVTSAQSETTLFDFVRIVIENARLLVVVPLLAGLVAYGMTFLVAPTFTATARISAGSNPRNSVEMYISLLRTRGIADKLIDRFDLLNVYGARYTEDARNVLATRTKVSSGKEGFIVLEVDDTEATRASNIANAYIEELAKLSSGLIMTAAQQRRAFLEDQLRHAQEKLKDAAVALDRTGAREKLFRSAPHQVIELARLRAYVTAQELRLFTMRGYLAERSPEYEIAQRDLETLRTALTRIRRDQPSDKSPHLDELSKFTEFKYHEILLDLVTKEYKLARMDEAREGSVVQVIDPPVRPERPSKPRRALYGVGAFLLTGLVMLLFVLSRDSYLSARRQRRASP